MLPVFLVNQLATVQTFFHAGFQESFLFRRIMPDAGHRRMEPRSIAVLANGEMGTDSDGSGIDWDFLRLVPRSPAAIPAPPVCTIRYHADFNPPHVISDRIVEGCTLASVVDGQRKRQRLDDRDDTQYIPTF